MSKILSRLQEENAIRVAGNMIRTLKIVDQQMANDTNIITAKEEMIKNSIDGKVSDSDLMELVNARARIKQNLERKQTYKIQFPAQAEKITDPEFKAEIQTEIEKL